MHQLERVVRPLEEGSEVKLDTFITDAERVLKGTGKGDDGRGGSQ